MQYIIVMSLSGSTLFLMYCLIEKLGKEYFSANSRYFLLKASLFFYLIPLGILADVYREMWGILEWWFPMLKGNQTAEIVKNEYIIYYTEKGIHYSKKMDILLGITILWIVFAILILVISFIKTKKKMQKMFACSKSIENDPDKELLYNLQKEYGIQRKINLYGYPVRLNPFTIGIKTPIVFVYEGEEKHSKELILRHELTHIKRNDVFIKLLAVLVKYIHWFNPLVYFLYKKLEEVCELSCDEILLENIDEDDRRKYAKIILETACDENNLSVGYGLSYEGSQIKERIEKIMKVNQKKGWNRILTTALIGMMVFANSFTVLANPVVMDVESKGSEKKLAFEEEMTVSMVAMEETFFVPNGIEAPYEVKTEEISYENQFVDKEGNVYPIKEEGVEIRVICLIHSYISGTNQQHTVSTDGSCTLVIYEAQRCEKCGKVKNGDVISSTVYTVCPH